MTEILEELDKREAKSYEALQKDIVALIATMKICGYLFCGILFLLVMMVLIDVFS